MATFFQDLPPEIAAEYAAIKRRQELADALTTQQLRRDRSTQFTPGKFSRAVPMSPLTGMTDLASAYITGRMRKGIEGDMRDLGAKSEKNYQDKFNDVMFQYRGRPEQAAVYSSPDQMGTGPIVPEVKPDPIGAIASAAGSGDPRMQRVADALLAASTAKGKRGGYFTTIPMDLGNGNYGWALVNNRTGEAKRLTLNEGGQAGLTPEMAQQALESGRGGPRPAPQVLKTTAGSEGATAEAKAEGKKIGEETGQAIIDQPKTDVDTDETVRLVQGLVDHPGMKDVIGFPDNPLVLKGLVPGTDAADFKAGFDQITGRTFLQIFPTLKGGGQITEIEGQKGQDAINRMKTATSEEAFKVAAQDFIDEVNRLRNIVRQRAGKGPVQPPSGDLPPGFVPDANSN